MSSCSSSGSRSGASADGGGRHAQHFAVSEKHSRAVVRLQHVRLTCVIAVVCAACQGSASQPPAPTTTPPPVLTEAAPPEPAAWAPPADAPPAAVAEPPRAPTPLPAATHGRAIIGIAVSDDGA